MKPILEKIRDKVLHRLVRIQFPHEIRMADQKHREDVVSQLPRVALETRHIENCQILLNRKIMLQKIGQRDMVAELGVNQGDFSQEILNISRPAVLHLVDIWGSERFHEGLFNEVQDKFKTEIERQAVRIHRKLSTEAASDFEDEYFDMIYIDTDHSYNTTRDELTAYSTKVKSDGIIAGHDYSMGNWIKAYRYGVIEAVHEFCIKYNWEILYLTADTLESQSFAIRRIVKD
ncbi:class I SAM-dependent methyltransferase [Prosthecobacter fusiformis]|nr:class I SAM-dependent methyltransferase [Prosthecobacter fusiformis]